LTPFAEDADTDLNHGNEGYPDGNNLNGKIHSQLTTTIVMLIVTTELEYTAE
jgi:hypothetical protein